MIKNVLQAFYYITQNKKNKFSKETNTRRPGYCKTDA